MNEGDLERYSRQARFAELGPSGQRALAKKRIVICGCGALGSASANLLVRAGVGAVRLIDRDIVEMSNLQRQVLFDEADAAAHLPKAEAAARALRRINSLVQIEARVADLDCGNIEALCGGGDLLLDGTDNFETRLLINDYSCQTGTPWIFGGAIGSEGQAMTIVPGRTPCLRCLIESAPPPGTGPTCETAGILAPVTSIIASFQAAEAIKILSGHADRINPGLLVLDVWKNTIRHLDLAPLRERSDCPVCQHRRFEWLAGKAGSRTTRLCGRNAVHVVPATRATLDLAELGRQLPNVQPLASNPFLLKFRVDGFELSVFEDGRAIVHGTHDPAVARSLYARYLG